MAFLSFLKKGTHGQALYQYSLEKSKLLWLQKAKIESVIYFIRDYNTYH